MISAKRTRVVLDGNGGKNGRTSSAQVERLHMHCLCRGLEEHCACKLGTQDQSHWV